MPRDVPRIALTDLTIRSLKSEKRIDFWDAKLPSFGVRVGPTSKTFIVKAGNARKSVGSYPEITLAEARKRAMALKAEKPKEGAATLFSTAYEEFKRLHVAQKRERTQRDYVRMLELYYLPEFRHRTLDSITPRQVSAALDAIADRPGEQWHAVAVGRTFFQFCVRRHHITSSPMEGMRIVKNRPRDRVLSDDEIRRLWTATEERKTFNGIVRLLLLTGQRRGEISRLQQSWLKDDEITIPKEATKNGREHRFPVGPLATSTLTDYVSPRAPNKEAFVFPARGRTHVPFSGWNTSKAALDEALGEGFPPWTLHDLRRTFATNMAKLGVRLEVTERLLNHVSGSLGGIVGVYQKWDFQPEMREAVKKYEAWLVRIGGL